MKAMILAAGRGERMRPLTDTLPKPLLAVGGKPLIVWHIERLAAAGIRQLVINHAYRGQQIEQALGDGQKWSVSIQYSPEPRALETAGGIANALPLLGDQPFLVVNGDVFTDIDFGHLAAMQAGLATQSVDAHLVLVPNPPQHPNGDFAWMDGQLQLEPASTSSHRYTFSGIALYRPALFAGIIAGQVAKLAPLLQAVISRHKATAEIHGGVWHDIGTPERLHALDRQLQLQKATPDDHNP